jgi:hypothetical protein
MKKVIYTAFVVMAFATSFKASAISCQVIEGDGGTGSASTKIEAKKAAWRQCISNKVARREASRGPVSVDDGIEDALACENADTSCK